MYKYKYVEVLMGIRWQFYEYAWFWDKNRNLGIDVNCPDVSWRRWSHGDGICYSGMYSRNYLISLSGQVNKNIRPINYSWIFDSVKICTCKS